MHDITYGKNKASSESIKKIQSLGKNTILQNCTKINCKIVKEHCKIAFRLDLDAKTVLVRRDKCIHLPS